MRSLLVAAVLVFAVIPSSALADAPPAARVATAAPSSSGVRYHELSKMLRRFKQQAEARAKVRVLAAR